MTEFNFRDVLDPKKNRRVAQLLEDDKAKWNSLKKEQQNQKIKIGTKSAIDKLYSSNKSNISFNDSGKVDIDKIAKTVRQNLSHNISSKGSYLDNYEVKENCSKAGGLFFDKNDVKVINKKDSKFKSIFSNLMNRKKEIEFTDIANLCRQELETKSPEFKSESNSDNNITPNQTFVEEDDSIVRTDLSKNHIISQLKQSFDIKDTYSNIAEDNLVSNLSVEEPKPSVKEPEQKKNLKDNVLSEFDSIFNIQR